MECKEPTESDKVAVCKKLVSNSELFFNRLEAIVSNLLISIAVRDKVVVKRTCAIESRTEVGEECAPVDTPSYVKTVFCETCRTDGCNANIATDYFALEDEFPLDELRKIQSQAPVLEDHNTSVFDVDNGEEDDDEDEDAEDNDIARDAGRRGSLVTHQDHRTETVHHAVDPELTQNGNSAAESTMIFSTLSLVSSTILAIYLSH